MSISLLLLCIIISTRIWNFGVISATIIYDERRLSMSQCIHSSNIHTHAYEAFALTRRCASMWADVVKHAENTESVFRNVSIVNVTGVLFHSREFDSVGVRRHPHAYDTLSVCANFSRISAFHPTSAGRVIAVYFVRFSSVTERQWPISVHGVVRAQVSFRCFGCTLHSAVANVVTYPSFIHTVTVGCRSITIIATQLLLKFCFKRRYLTYVCAFVSVRIYEFTFPIAQTLCSDKNDVIFASAP